MKLASNNNWGIIRNIRINFKFFKFFDGDREVEKVNFTSCKVDEVSKLRSLHVR